MMNSNTGGLTAEMIDDFPINRSNQLSFEEIEKTISYNSFIELKDYELLDRLREVIDLKTSINKNKLKIKELLVELANFEYDLLNLSKIYSEEEYLKLLLEVRSREIPSCDLICSLK